MTKYKLYFLDRSDRAAHSTDLECLDDDHACDAVLGHVGAHAMELWRDDCFVAYFYPRLRERWLPFAPAGEGEGDRR